MTQKERLIRLTSYLCGEMPEYSGWADELRDDEQSLFTLFRSLVNVRPPREASPEFLKLQDEYLSLKLYEKGITDIADLKEAEDGIYLWRGDITALKCEAIVNAANNRMLGCFCPCHGCIDNAIHTFSGVQLRQKCAEIMREKGFAEPCGSAIITPAYNLPSDCIIHTVGPIISGEVTKNDCELLASCYTSCLSLAEEKNIKSIAFPCISTGEYHFPADKAARIAIDAVKAHRERTHSKTEVIFNVYKESDYNIYRDLLGTN